MKRLLIILPLFLGLTAGIIARFDNNNHAFAYSSNNLISDFNFDNTTTLTAAQIDTWLNTFPNSCISTNNGFDASDPTGYSPFYPHVDGKYVYGGMASAGQVIYDVAKAHQINPQVLLTKLQNEEQLVDGSQGCDNWRYTSAVGYACTGSDTFTHTYTYTGADPFSDSSALATPLYYHFGTPVNSISGSCVNTNVFAGFSEQVVHAAWHLSIWRHKSEGQTSFAAITGNWNHCDDNNTCPASMNIPSSWACYDGSRMTQGTFQLCPNGPANFYDGYTSIDGTTVHMDNGATAALYNYTPHFQSFDTIFSQYFGNPDGPFYQFSSATNPPFTMEYGQVATAELKLLNTSTQTWYSDGNTPAGDHPFRIMNRGYRNSQFADTQDSAWLGTQNQIRMVEPAVASGQVATFRFNVRAPDYAVGYDELNLVLVQDGVQVYQDFGLQFRLSSNPDYAYTVNSVVAPSGLLPGDMYRVIIQLKNTGIETWYSDGKTPAGVHPMRIATPFYVNSPYAQPRVDSAWLGTQNQIKMAEDSVAPGQYASFVATFTAPYQAVNKYSPNFELVQDGVKFIAGPSIPLTLSTPAPVVTYSFVSATNPPRTMNPGQQAQVYIKIKNTGNTIWRSFDYKILSMDGSIINLGDTRMITSNPPYGNSTFAVPSDSSWLGTQNQIRMVEPVVAPGQVGTFATVLQAPASTGNYIQYFTFAVDGLTVMRDIGLGYAITVSP
jgi:hypothetical protein